MSAVPRAFVAWFVSLVACARAVAPSAPAEADAAGLEIPAVPSGDDASPALDASTPLDGGRLAYIDAHCQRSTQMSPSYHTVDKRTGQTMEVFGAPVHVLTCPDDAPYPELRGTNPAPP